jgi:hypothetical protein
MRTTGPSRQHTRYDGRRTSPASSRHSCPPMERACRSPRIARVSWTTHSSGAAKSAYSCSSRRKQARPRRPTTRPRFVLSGGELGTGGDARFRERSSGASARPSSATSARHSWGPTSGMWRDPTGRSASSGVRSRGTRPRRRRSPLPFNVGSSSLCGGASASASAVASAKRQAARMPPRSLLTGSPAGWSARR